MSYHVFFSFSTGLTNPIRVPTGTHVAILNRIAQTEDALGLKRELTYTPKGEPQRPGWHWRDAGAQMIAHLGARPQPVAPNDWSNIHAWEAQKDAICQTVRQHNDFVRRLYDTFAAKHKKDTETITPVEAVEFWGGLAILEVPQELWTRDHYKEHLRHIGRLLLDGEDEGVMLNCKLTPKQAAAILNLIDCELDRAHDFDVRAALTLDSHLQQTGGVGFSDDGGYDWCEHCGPIDTDSFHARVRRCSRAKCGKCPLKNAHQSEFE
jgi:hypothetical protein